MADDQRIVETWQCNECKPDYSCQITLDKKNKYCNPLMEKRRTKCLAMRGTRAFFMRVG